MSDNVITGSSVAGPSRVVTGANATLTRKDFALEVATAGADRTVTLPHINSMRNRWYLIKVAPGSANDVIVTAQAGQTLDGAGSITLNLSAAPFSSLLLFAPSKGVDWWVGPGPQELSSPVITGDIEFTNTADHLIFVDASVTGNGHSLSVFSADAGDATALLPGGDGGQLGEAAGNGGDGSALQAPGVGGAIVRLAGSGGDAGGLDPGAAGGESIETAGDGGAALAAQPGGPGGDITKSAGDGGAGSAGALAGPGGDVIQTAGDAGANGGAGGNDGGDFEIDAGAGSGAGLDGLVRLGGTVARGVELGRTGKETAVLGSLSVQQDTSLKGNLIAGAGQVATALARAFANSPYTALSSDFGLYWDTVGGACVQALPAIAGVRGQQFEIVKTSNDANTLTIDPSGAETIGGLSTLVLTTRASVCIQAPGAGTDWVIVSDSSAAEIDRKPSRVGLNSASSPITVALQDYGFQISPDVGAIVVNLPQIATCRGKEYAFNVADLAANTTLTPFAGDTINFGAGTLVLVTGAGNYSVQLLAPMSGVDWIVSGYGVI